MRRPGRVGGDKPLLQQGKCRTTQPVGGQLNGAERRRTEGRRHDIVKTQYRNVIGNPDTGIRQCFQTAKGQIVGSAENRRCISERALLGQQATNGGFAPLGFITLHLNDHIRRHRKPRRKKCVAIAVVTAADRRAPLPGNVQNIAVPKGKQVLDAEAGAETVLGRHRIYDHGRVLAIDQHHRFAERRKRLNQLRPVIVQHHDAIHIVGIRRLRHRDRVKPACGADEGHDANAAPFAFAPEAVQHRPADHVEITLRSRIVGHCQQHHAQGRNRRLLPAVFEITERTGRFQHPLAHQRGQGGRAVKGVRSGAERNIRLLRHILKRRFPVYFHKREIHPLF